MKFIVIDSSGHKTIETVHRNRIIDKIMREYDDGKSHITTNFTGPTSGEVVLYQTDTFNELNRIVYTDIDTYNKEISAHE